MGFEFSPYVIKSVIRTGNGTGIAAGECFLVLQDCKDGEVQTCKKDYIQRVGQS